MRITNGWTALTKLQNHIFNTSTAKMFRVWRIELANFGKAPYGANPEIEFFEDGTAEMPAVLPDTAAEAVIVYAEDWDFSPPVYPLLLTQKLLALPEPAVSAWQALPQEIVRSIAAFCRWDTDEPIYAYALTECNGTHTPAVC